MSSNPTVELWTLYAFGVAFTILRTYARATAVGFRDFCADDYLIWLAVVGASIYNQILAFGWHANIWLITQVFS